MNAALALAWVRYLTERLGWPGLLGLALAVAAAAVQFAAVEEAERRNADLRLEIARWSERLAAGPADLPAAESRALARLPGGSSLAPVVALVHAAAQRRQIVLDQGEYAWQGEAGRQAARYRMIFPVHGTYPQLRGWAADVLAARPELALEEFSFRRENIGSETVEARIRFTAAVENRS